MGSIIGAMIAFGLDSDGVMKLSFGKKKHVLLRPE